MESRFFRTRDGFRLHYISHPCVTSDCDSYCILLHGFTNDAHVWDTMADVLRRHHHVIALDQRGHGDSDWDPEHRYSHWQLADDLEDLLQVFDGARIHVIGHSLGARVSMLALESTRIEVASLTIVDAGPEVNPDAGERLVNDVMQMPAYYADSQAYLDCMARVYVMADSSVLANMARFSLRVTRGRLAGKTDPAFTPGIWHNNPEFRQRHREKGELSDQIWTALRSLDLPVHIVRGQASSILESSLARRMIDELKGRGVLSIVPRAGHAVMLDNPVKSTDLIAQFIRDLDQSGSPAVWAEKELVSLV
ncbi:alpha/beta hydrolase [Pseudohongiella acticola]|jgi:pimeloyl-ACP methyl ester carboxylesterase|uniref:alpha/beta fold hydrolase n=1 Tax=Pseudohongiella acticola TaxID=1524254 RepID=UPI0030ED5582